MKGKLLWNTFVDVRTLTFWQNYLHIILSYIITCLEDSYQNQRMEWQDKKMSPQNNCELKKYIKSKIAKLFVYRVEKKITSINKRTIFTIHFWAEIFRNMFCLFIQSMFYAIICDVTVVSKLLCLFCFCLFYFFIIS